eukprot:scaffold499424_cov23-Prasinocladus_malaysianus.AAC.1
MESSVPTSAQARASSAMQPPSEQTSHPPPTESRAADNTSDTSEPRTSNNPDLLQADQPQRSDNLSSPTATMVLRVCMPCWGPKPLMPSAKPFHSQFVIICNGKRMTWACQSI